MHAEMVMEQHSGAADNSTNLLQAVCCSVYFLDLCSIGPRAVYIASLPLAHAASITADPAMLTA